MTIDAAGDRTTTLFDAAGNATAVFDGLDHETQYLYDALNRQSVVIDSASNRTTTLFDANGNTTAVFDGLDHETQYLYDALNRQSVTVDPLSNRTTTLFDAVGNVTSLTDADNNTTEFSYDALNRKISETDPLSHTATWAYNADGLVTGSTDRLGRQIDSLYDAVNRLTGQTWLDATSATTDTLTFTYDAAGNQLTAANSNGAYTLTYDALNRVSAAQEPFGTALTLTYDAAGRRTQVQDSFGGLQTSLYDAVNRLTSQQFSDSAGTTLRADQSYNADSQPLTLSRYSDLSASTTVATTSYTYDTDNRVSAIQHFNGAGTSLATYTYTYDAASNVATQVINGTTTTYTYDADNQLTGDGTTAHTYDATGNRTNTGYSTTANELTSDGTWDYTYDAEGNLSEKVNIASGYAWTYGYDNANHLVQAKLWTADPGSGGWLSETVNYKYDAWGNRLEQNWFFAPLSGTVVQRYAYGGWDPATPAGVGTTNFEVWADLDGNNSNALQTRYLRGDQVDQLFGRIGVSGTTETPYWYLTDRLGSARDVLDGSGAVKDTIGYDAFGNITSESASTYRGRYAWTGRELDAETGLQYNRARYYDSTTGRWISQDPLGFDAGDSNVYRYVTNAPTFSTDPTGLETTGGPVLFGDLKDTTDLENFLKAFDLNLNDVKGDRVIAKARLLTKDGTQYSLGAFHDEWEFTNSKAGPLVQHWEARFYELKSGGWSQIDDLSLNKTEVFRNPSTGPDVHNFELMIDCRYKEGKILVRFAIGPGKVNGKAPPNEDTAPSDGKLGAIQWSEMPLMYGYSLVFDNKGKVVSFESVKYSNAGGPGAGNTLQENIAASTALLFSFP